MSCQEQGGIAREYEKTLLLNLENEHAGSWSCDVSAEDASPGLWRSFHTPRATQHSDVHFQLALLVLR